MSGENSRVSRISVKDVINTLLKFLFGCSVLLLQERFSPVQDCISRKQTASNTQTHAFVRMSRGLDKLNGCFAPHHLTADVFHMDVHMCYLVHLVGIIVHLVEVVVGGLYPFSTELRGHRLCRERFKQIVHAPTMVKMFMRQNNIVKGQSICLDVITHVRLLLRPWVNHQAVLSVNQQIGVRRDWGIDKPLYLDPIAEYILHQG